MDLKELRENIVGLNTLFETPYGERMMTYADFTASGRSLKFIEKYMLEIQKIYANSHTDDDCTGKTMTGLLHKSEEIIKKELNASKNCMIIATGNGSTGAIAKFSEILGIYMPPETKAKLERLVDDFIHYSLAACFNRNRYLKAAGLFHQFEKLGIQVPQGNVKDIPNKAVLPFNEALEHL